MPGGAVAGEAAEGRPVPRLPLRALATDWLRRACSPPSYRSRRRARWPFPGLLSTRSTPGARRTDPRSTLRSNDESRAGRAWVARPCLPIPNSVSRSPSHPDFHQSFLDADRRFRGNQRRRSRSRPAGELPPAAERRAGCVDLEFLGFDLRPCDFVTAVRADGFGRADRRHVTRRSGRARR